MERSALFFPHCRHAYDWNKRGQTNRHIQSFNERYVARDNKDEAPATIQGQLNSLPPKLSSSRRHGNNAYAKIFILKLFLVYAKPGDVRLMIQLLTDDDVNGCTQRQRLIL
jgi:hypothetical protein